MKARIATEKVAAASRASNYRLSSSVTAVMLALAGMCHSNLSLAENDARPFQATFFAAPTGPLTVAGSGIASHLGIFQLDVSRLVSSAPSPSDPCVGFLFIDATLTAANGDEVNMSYTGGELCFEFTNFPVVSFAGSVSFAGTGGTGRFLGSTGVFKMFWSGESSPLGTTTDGTIDGVIGY